MSEPSDPLTPTTGFAALVGYRIADWSWGRAAVELPVAAAHLNRSGILHGGVLTTLVDTACGYSGCFCDTPGRGRRAMTLQLNTQFLAPAQAGQRLTARAHTTGGGRSVFFADCTVHADDGTLIGRGDGVFKYAAGSGDPAGIPLARLPGS
ncbi:PaaI family thioesterase [Rhodovibrio sodomensis]|nr:PaaI family thioesterase [Rhodovibrio sodomensis]